jgi:two-component system cell cycle sensor histidine kinase/response regulator CckA
VDYLVFLVFGDPDRDDFLKTKAYLEWLQPRVGRLITVLVPGTGLSLGALDYPGWARWALGQGADGALVLPLIRLSELPWAGPGTVDDLPVFFLRPPADDDFTVLASELDDFLGIPSQMASASHLEFVVGTSPDTAWLWVKGGPELVQRMGFLVDYLCQPPVKVTSADPRWDTVQLRNALFERDATVKRLTREVQRYRRFFEDDITGNFVAGPGGRVVDCNRAFARMFGFPSVDYALGFDLRRLFTDRKDLRRLLSIFVPRLAVEDRDLELVRPDGRKVSVIANLSGLRDDNGRLVQVRGFLFDNTPRKALESQLREAQKLEGLGRLAGGIAHDFNNLLTVINGYTELLLSDGPADRPEAHELGEILQAGLKAAELTRQLLAFSRRQSPAPRVIDLGDVVAKMESMVRRLVNEPITVVVDRDPSPLPFLADRGQIEQVILNLVLNARDALPDGGTLTLSTRSVTLTSSVYRSGEFLLPGTYVRLSVSDTGVGMDDETRQRVFEPFFTTKAHGTGLGLAMVHGIVQQTGGQLQLDTEPGVGTTFTLYFEQAGSPDPEILDRPPASVPLPLSLGAVVVEDDLAVRQYVERILLRHGFRVAAYGDAEAALSLLQAEGRGWSVVVSDIVLPGISGLHFGQKLRELGIDIPFLSMSGYTDDEIVRLGLEPQGMNYIHKPFQSKDLIQAIAALLDRD